MPTWPFLPSPRQPLRTCWVTVAGLTRHPGVPAVEIRAAVFTVWPIRVILAILAMATMPGVPVQLPVVKALIRPATAVACWVKSVMVAAQRRQEPAHSPATF